MGFFVEVTGLEPVSFLFNNKWLHVYSIGSQLTNSKLITENLQYCFWLDFQEPSNLLQHSSGGITPWRLLFLGYMPVDPIVVSP